jgi:hypothetical protein
MCRKHGLLRLKTRRREIIFGVVDELKMIPKSGKNLT